MAKGCSHGGLLASLVLLAAMGLHQAHAVCLNATASASATFCRTLSTLQPVSGSSPCNADPGCGVVTDATTGTRTCGTLAQYCGAQSQTFCVDPQLAGICGTCVNLFPAATPIYCSGLSTLVASGADTSPCNADPGCGVVATQTATTTTRACLPVDAYCAAQSDCTASNLGGTCGPPGSSTATNTDTGSDFVCLAQGTPGTAAFCRALSTVTPTGGTSPCNADPGCGAVSDSTTGTRVCIPLDVFCGVAGDCPTLQSAGVCRQVLNTGICIPAATPGTSTYCSALSTAKPAAGGLSPCTADPGCGVLNSSSGTTTVCRPLDAYCAADNNCNYKCPPSNSTSTGTTGTVGTTGTTTTSSPRASGPTTSASPRTTGTITRAPASAPPPASPSTGVIARSPVSASPPASPSTSGIVITTGRLATPPARAPTPAAQGPSRSAPAPAPGPTTAAPTSDARVASPVATSRTGTAVAPAPSAKDGSASDTGSRVLDLGLTG